MVMVKDKIKTQAFGFEDFYHYYRYRGGKMNKDAFRKAINLFFKKLVNSIYQGNIIQALFGLGYFYIQKFKPTYKRDKNGNWYLGMHRAVNWGITNKLWKDKPELRGEKYIFYDNSHTDDYSFKLKRTVAVSSKINGIYVFKACRSFRSNLAKVIFKNPNIEYIEK